MATLVGGGRRSERRTAPRRSVADDDEAAARWEVHPLESVAPLIRECLAGIADDAAHLMVVSDADGTLLWLEGAPQVRLAAANSMNFAVGALWSEGGAGTNAIGTALAADHAVQVFAAEHFNEVVQAWTCAAAPVHDPDTGDLIGVIDLTSRMSTVHPHSFAVAVATAGAVEAHLRCLMHERDGRLRARYVDRVLGGSDDRALVTSSGRVIATSPQGWMPAERLALPDVRRRVHAAVGRARVRGAAGSRRGVPDPPARARAGGPFRRRGPAARAGRRSPARGRRRPPAAARPPAGRDPRAAVPAPRRPDHRAAGLRGLRRRREQQHGPRRGLALAQAARAGDRDGPLPLRRPRRVRPRARAHAARARGDPGGGGAVRRAAAAALRRAGRRARAPGARGLDPARGDDGRRPRGGVGVGPDPLRPRGPGGAGGRCCWRWTTATRGAARRRRRSGGCARSRLGDHERQPGPLRGTAGEARERGGGADRRGR